MARRFALVAALIGLAIPLAYVTSWTVLSFLAPVRSGVGSMLIALFEALRVVLWPSSLLLMPFHGVSTGQWWGVVVTAAVANAFLYALIGSVLGWLFGRV